MKKFITTLALAGMVSIASPALAYQVQPGDTMSGIAIKEEMTLQELSLLNPQVRNLDLIFTGQTINTNTKEVSKQPKPTVQKVKAASIAKVNTVLTPYEKDLLARLVRAEALGEPYAGKVAVAEVVLNRVDSDKFPNSVEGVIYQKGQFSPVTNGSINKPADSESIRAVEEAITLNRSLGAQSLFFYNPSIATSSWLDNKQTTKVIGNHVFKR